MPQSRRRGLARSRSCLLFLESRRTRAFSAITRNRAIGRCSPGSNRDSRWRLASTCPRCLRRRGLGIKGIFRPHPIEYRSSNDKQRGVVPCLGALTGRRVKIRRPRVALFLLGYNFTLASNSAISCGTDGTLPHLHSPRSIQLSWRRPTTSIWTCLSRSSPTW